MNKHIEKISLRHNKAMKGVKMTPQQGRNMLLYRTIRKVNEVIGQLNHINDIVHGNCDRKIESKP